MKSWVWPVFMTGYRRQMAFRRAMLLGAVGSIGYAVIRLVVLESLYRDRDIVSGLSLEQASVWAIFAGMLFTIVYPPWSHDFPDSIRSGEVVSDLLRPVSTFAFQLAHQSGRLVAQALVRVTPFLILALWILPVHAPDGLAGWSYFLVSLVFLAMSSVAFIYMLGTTAFFTADHHVWLAFAFYAVQLLGGVYLPVEFIPGWAGDLVRAGPGMAFIASPTRILNDIQPLQTLVIQGIWTVVFCGLAYSGLYLGRKRLVVFGG